MPIRISVQGRAQVQASWLDLARRVESVGFDGLYVSDHLGTSASPFVALAAAASVTQRIRLGTCVVNAGVWEPIRLASEVATLDMLSAGRALLGVGAGHTPDEWTARGLALPSASERVGRMTELANLTQALLAGNEVSADGEHFSLVGARLSGVLPTQVHVPLLVGGNGSRLLRFAATHADVVGITGLGKLLQDGHHHEAEWSNESLRRTTDLVFESAAAVSRHPQLEALVQHVRITDDAEAEAGELAELVPGATVMDLLTTPYLWLGTVDEIRSRLETISAEFGIDRYVVRDDAIDDVLRVVDGLATI